MTIATVKFENLPQDIQIDILHENIGQRSQFSLMRVCKKWYQHVQEGIKRHCLTPLFRSTLSFPCMYRKEIARIRSLSDNFQNEVSYIRYLSSKFFPGSILSITLKELESLNEEKYRETFDLTLGAIWNATHKKLPKDCKAPLNIPHIHSHYQFKKDLKKAAVPIREWMIDPKNASVLEQIYELNLDGQILEGILPPELTLLRNLKKLNLSHNIIMEISPVIWDFEELEELDMHNCNLQSIPHEIKRLKKLRRLLLDTNKSDCGVKLIPSAISELKELEELVVNGLDQKCWKYLRDC